MKKSFIEHKSIKIIKINLKKDKNKKIKKDKKIV